MTFAPVLRAFVTRRTGNQNDVILSRLSRLPAEPEHGEIAKRCVASAS